MFQKDRVLLAGGNVSSLQPSKRRDFTFLQQTLIVWNKNICKNVSLVGLGGDKPSHQIPSLHSLSLCHLAPEMTAGCLCLGNIIRCSKKYKGPVREWDCKMARNRILLFASLGCSTLAQQNCKGELYKNCWQFSFVGLGGGFVHLEL